ncbi:MAG: hypothetical protein ACNI28_06150 [Arcobacter sp.]|uniref:hypothetical protein n=1 Tax=Arcobacter sp. TaxID=1872629 RepID=UPI003AFFE0C7
MIRNLSVFLFLISFSLANNLTNPQIIYQKKCQMCHALDYPDNIEEKKAQVGPNILMVMKNLNIGIEAVEEPKNKEELRELVIEFINDYIFEPTPQKSYCEEVIFKHFDYMPSLKGFISKKEAQIVVPWVYDNFSPKEE